MNKIIALSALTMGLCMGYMIEAKANNVNIKCWSGNRIIYNDIVSEWKIDITNNYVLVNKNGKANIIIGDCILSRKLKAKMI